MEQHVALIDFHQAWEHPSSLWVQCLWVEVEFEGVEERDHPVEGFGCILLTSDGDGRDKEGFALVRPSFCGPGPAVWMGYEMLEYGTGNEWRGVTCAENSLGE